MNTFCLFPADVPGSLYRVQYGDSMTTYDIYEGLEAVDTVTLYDDGGDEQEEDDTLQEFGDAVEQHLSWDTDYESIFISLFSQRRHAENWMLDRHTRFGSRNCTLLQIDTSALNGSFIFRAEEIVHELSLSIPEAAQASVAREYLIAHYIPPRAIIRSQTADEIHAGKIKPFSVGSDVAWEPTVLCFRILDLEAKKY
ncbi:hypothetical protein N7481_004915 [Penicillium waksmanii]|uniref:uncharacterized protein n=1 Tax=Penicillium waksmanii TaxID=69791 RepID=UPI0025492DEE|nr:uncharacterized protein N7481_004915 [Penicillium waksmanii]KAJ5989705.1 hypothetical protein N7481_004915 [Penicillium waksmanii]